MKPKVFEIAWWLIGKVKPYERNARKLSESAVAKVAQSIEKYGWRQPIVVDRKGVIIAGHTRLLAAQKLGLKQVPIHVAKDLSEAEVKAYRLMDNRSHQESTWDELLLGPELADLKALDFDLSATGFEPLEIEGLFAKLQPPSEADPDAAPGVETFAVTVPGDIWICGRHRVMCGDSTQVDAMQALCAGEVALIFTDPPYGVSFEQGKNIPRRKQAKVDRGFDAITGDALTGEELTAALQPAFSNAYIVAVEGCPVYAWSPGSPAHGAGVPILRAVEAAGFQMQSQLIWHKRPFVIGRADYHWAHEICWYGWKPGAGHHWYGDRDKSTIWEVNKPQKSDLHPTMKPVELALIGLNNSSQPGDLVLDLYAGSGSTLIACEQLGRQGRAMELDPKYVDVIVKRWQTFTGKEATLEATGATFPALSRSRAKAA